MIRGTGDKVVLGDFFNSKNYQQYTFEFADGMKMEAVSPESILNIMEGTEGNDNLTALFDMDSRLYGFAGDDYLYRKAGNDVLDGGTGNDYLNGGTGSDTSLMMIVMEYLSWNQDYLIMGW